MTINELNLLDQSEFVQAIGWVFEHSPWVAERAWPARPFADLNGLHAAMAEQVERATFSERLDLLKAHPELGTRARLTTASTQEQAGAGLDSLTPSEFEYLQRLNGAYRNRFGFPFLLAVKGSTKYDVLKALEVRSKSSPEEEFTRAVTQVCRIARFRLEDLITDPGRPVSEVA